MIVDPLNIIWFFLVALLLGGYGVLDGFDLGVGIQHLFTKKEKRRLLHIKSIGPLWDGNEVWLLTGGGALFAAFPPVYAAVFSGFYSALMLLLVALIFRALSLEFRNQVDSPGWKKAWDWAFGLGSAIPALLFGVAVGNVLRGLPLKDGIINVNFFALLNPYSLIVGLMTLSFFALHGATYLLTKADDDYRKDLHKRINTHWIVFVSLFIVATFYTVFEAAYLFDGVFTNILWWLFVVMTIGGILYTPIANKGEKGFLVFISTTVTMLGMVGATAVSMFPLLVPSSIDPAFSLTAMNSSTPLTLQTMLIVVIIGVPIMLGYTFWIYKLFWGKVEISQESY